MRSTTLLLPLLFSLHACGNAEPSTQSTGDDPAPAITNEGETGDTTQTQPSEDDPAPTPQPAPAPADDPAPADEPAADAAVATADAGSAARPTAADAAVTTPDAGATARPTVADAGAAPRPTAADAAVATADAAPVARPTTADAGAATQPADAGATARAPSAITTPADAGTTTPTTTPTTTTTTATACAAAAGGGSTTVRAPTRLLALRDTGSESWLGAPAVADLDRDGSPEVIVAREQRVVAWRASGAVRWAAQPGTGRVWAPPVVGDFTGDANLEVVAASGDRVVMYTAAGAVAPGFPVRLRDEVRALAAGDLDGDGRPEIVAASTTTAGTGAREDLLMAWRGNGAAVAGFPPNASGASRCDSACDVAGAFDQNLAVGFLDADNRADVVAPTDNAYMSWHRGSGEAFPVSPLFRGVTRSPGVRFFTDYAQAQAGWTTNEATSEQAHFTSSAPAIADLDGDGTREIIALGSIQNAAQTDRRRGVGLFVVRPDGTRPAAWVAPFQARTYLAGLEDFGDTNVVGMTNQVAVANVDAASAGLEVVFAGFDGRVWCVGANRSTRWSYQYTTANNVVTGGAVIADLSGDGRPEVIFATYSPASGVSALFVLDARGALLHRIALPGRGAMAVPAVADLNRDGTMEIVVSLKDATPTGDEVLVYTVPGSSTNCAPWPMGRRSPLRDGSVPRA